MFPVLSASAWATAELRLAAQCLRCTDMCVSEGTARIGCDRAATWVKKVAAALAGVWYSHCTLRLAQLGTQLGTTIFLFLRVCQGWGAIVASLVPLHESSQCPLTGKRNKSQIGINQVQEGIGRGRQPAGQGSLRSNNRRGGVEERQEALGRGRGTSASLKHETRALRSEKHGMGAHFLQEREQHHGQKAESG
jgi:hypothetical protein